MKAAIGVGCFLALICLSLGSTQGDPQETLAIETDPIDMPRHTYRLEPKGTHPDLWYIKTDPAVISVDLIWGEPARPDKRDLRDQDGPSLTHLGLCAQRPICWRLESGSIDKVDWKGIRAKLASSYGCGIGSNLTCSVVGEISAPPCHRATADVYAAYSRDFWEVKKDNRVIASFSVLIPTDGVALVYRSVERLARDNCQDELLSRGPQGICASLSDRPFNGSTCPPWDSNKDHFHDGPEMDHPSERTTWGAIKLLYD